MFYDLIHDFFNKKDFKPKKIIKFRFFFNLAEIDFFFYSLVFYNEQIAMKF